MCVHCSYAVVVGLTTTLKPWRVRVAPRDSSVLLLERPFQACLAASLLRHSDVMCLCFVMAMHGSSSFLYLVIIARGVPSPCLRVLSRWGHNKS